MSRPIRAAHVVASAGATGVESYLLTLLPGFDPSEVSAVLVVPGDGVLVERARRLGLEVRFGSPTRKLAFGESDALARAVAGCEVVHGHGPRASFWAERAARRAGVPAFVETIHELRWQTVPKSFKRGLWLAIERRTLRHARRLITVSEATRRDLIAHWPELATKTRVVHASAPMLLDVESVPRAGGVATTGGPLRLVTVGRFDWQKGYDRMLPALALLRDRGIDWSLDVVGAGAGGDAIHRMSARLGLDSHIRWHGATADVPRLLAGAQAFVTATRAEMFGIAVLEAMAVGLPVVAPAVGSLPELIVDHGTGALVAPAPEAEFAARFAGAIEGLARDPERRARLGEAGAARARERFTPRALAAGVARVYREMLESDGAAPAAVRRHTDQPSRS